MTEPISPSTVAAPVIHTYSPTLPEPYIRSLIFIGSLLFLYYGVEGLLTGVIFTRMGPAYRDRQPCLFWTNVGFWFLFSAVLVCLGLWRIYFGPP
jgi:hypothetical protein